MSKYVVLQVFVTRWNFGVIEVVAVPTVTATVVALGDVKTNRCGQKGGQLMMTGRSTDTVMQIHTKSHQLIARRRNQVLTVEDQLVRFLFTCLINAFNVRKASWVDVRHHVHIMGLL